MNTRNGASDGPGTHTGLPHAPQTCASADSATLAYFVFVAFATVIIIAKDCFCVKCFFRKLDRFFTRLPVDFRAEKTRAEKSAVEANCVRTRRAGFTLSKIFCPNCGTVRLRRCAAHQSALHRPNRQWCAPRATPYHRRAPKVRVFQMRL